MATSFSSQLSADPLYYPDFKGSAAENFSYIPVGDPTRPLFAQAVYIVNPSDIASAPISTNSTITSLVSTVEVNLTSGFDFFADNKHHAGNYTSLQVVSACLLAGLTATNTNIYNLTAFPLPQTLVIEATIQAVRLTYGSVIMYK